MCLSLNYSQLVSICFFLFYLLFVPKAKYIFMEWKSCGLVGTNKDLICIFEHDKDISQQNICIFTFIIDDDGLHLSSQTC